MLRKLKVILWKNLLIRRRHWLLTITEILVPILLFTLIAYGRSKISGMNKTEVKDATYQEPLGISDLNIHLPIGEFSLWYAPYTNFSDTIIRKVQEKFQIPGDAIKDFGSEEDLLKHFTKNSSNSIAAIIFRGGPPNLNYDISIYNKYFQWDTDKLFTPMMDMEGSGSSKYIYKGFAALQIAVDTVFMELFTNQHINFVVQEFPMPPYTSDSGLSQLFIKFLPLVTVFSFVFICPAVLTRVGEEKLSGTKEFLKMVGMESWMLWLGWFIHALFSNLFSIIAIVILMKVSFWGVSYPPIEYSDGTVLFVFLFLYCMAAVTFCFLIATIFNNPSIATVIGILIWIFSYFVPQTIISSNESMRWMYKIIFAIFPNMALHYGYTAVGVYELREIGIQWYNIFQSGSGGEDDVTMGCVFLSFIFETLIFMLLTLYLENVKPGIYGIAKPINYPVLNVINWVKTLLTINQVEHNTEFLMGTKSERKPCITIKNLRKNFDKHVAVEDLSMDIYENAITVLLGHNGAGKSTTMYILTGMISATEGSIVIDGKNIKKHTNEVRSKIGLCPQHNLLFPDLTAMEHLQFFGMLREGGKSFKEEAETLLKKFNIEKDAMASTLSGGMKRKLCLGMALIGNPKVLILDEPTSGMDPESRREVWNILLDRKKTKTILISTHFMEEADVLGDWIAIMANGRLQCYDTPMGLKTRYNTGYHLVLELNSTASIQRLTKEIKREIPDASLLREQNENVIYLLPLNCKPSYAHLFGELEKRKDSWGIVTMGLNITTLNDVFLKAKDEIDGSTTITENGTYNEAGNDIFSLPKLRGMEHHRGVSFSLILKRWYFFKRKFCWYIPAIVVTICIFLVTIWLGMADSHYYDYGGPKLNFSLNVYGKTGVLYGGSEDFPNHIVYKMQRFYRESILNQKGDPVLVKDVSQGIIEKGTDNIAYYKKHMIVAAEFNASQDEILVNAMYSKTALHGLPISINLAMNAVLKSFLNDSFSITTANAPLKPLYLVRGPIELSEVSVGILWLILIPTGMFFFLSNFIIFPNSEVSTHFIKIQTMAGVHTFFYWLSNVFFDSIICAIQLVVLFLGIIFVDNIAFETKSFGRNEYSVLIVILFCNSVISLPFTYLFSYRKTTSGGVTLLIMFGMFIGIIPTLVIRAMEYSGDNYYMEIGKYLKHLFLCISPPFSLSYISVMFSEKFVQNFNWIHMSPHKKKHICDIDPNPCCYGDDTLECNIYKSYYHNDEFGVFKDLLEMWVSFLLYISILCIINTQNFEKMLHYLKYWKYYVTRCGKSKEENLLTAVSVDEGDSDNNDTSRLLAKNLSKSFGNKNIVNDLKLTLKRQRCFGLLGVNGAGKSTTFRMLTKDTFFDKGEITMPLKYTMQSESTNNKNKQKKESITVNESEYSQKIGYCPQEDCLNYFLTGKELLTTVAIMKGCSVKNSEQIADNLLKLFDLNVYAEKPCLEYSGGNKRKLCSCIAFLGSPSVILLDEPTSGVDPASRRNFWNILSSFKKNQDASFLLCSHSMEECEALCDEIGIMKNGQIKDQGTLPALKNKHQNGFTIEIKLKSVNSDNSEIEDAMNTRINAVLNKDSYSDLQKYHVGDANMTLSKLFSIMEELKTKYGVIDDYTINQISLEEIFLNIAKQI